MSITTINFPNSNKNVLFSGDLYHENDWEDSKLWNIIKVWSLSGKGLVSILRLSAILGFILWFQEYINEYRDNIAKREYVG